MRFSEPVAEAMTAMYEATIKHGKVIGLMRFDDYPKAVQQKILAAGMQYGYDEKRIRDIMNRRGGGRAEISLSDDDAFEGLIKHCIEKYDKEQDEAILASDNLVESYNAMITGRFNEAAALAKQFMARAKLTPDGEVIQNDENSELVVELLGGVDTDIAMMTDNLVDLSRDAAEMGLSEEDIRSVIVNAYFRPSNDPEEIRRIVNARIKYNNSIIAMFRTMIRENYKLLGYTTEQAELLLTQLQSSDQSAVRSSVVDIKQAIVKNQNQFLVRPGVYDFRKIGAGCIFLTIEDMDGLEDRVTNDRMIQLLMEHDAVVVGHGNSYNRNQMAYWNRMRDEINAEFNRRDKEIMEYRRRELDKVQENTEMLQKARAAEVKSLCTKYINQTKQRKKIVDAYDARWAEVRRKQSEALDAYIASLRNSSLDSDALKHKYELWQKMAEQVYDTYTAQRDRYYALESELSNLRNSLVYDDAFKDKLRQDHDAAIKQLYDIVYQMNKENTQTANAAMRDVSKQAERIERRYHNESRWTIQKVNTLDAGPFTDVNDLIRQLIREGFKDIYIVSCNPGQLVLDKDIRNKPGIKIQHAMRSLLAETSYPYTEEQLHATIVDLDTITSLDHISEIEKDLMEACNNLGIDYRDDRAINEAAEGYMRAHVMNEGVLSNVWRKLVEIIKGALGLIVKIFKGIINFFRKVIDAIKNFFKKIFGRHGSNAKLDRPVKSNAIFVENARVNTITTTSMSAVQDAVLKACNALSSKIKEVERKQVSNMEELKRYSEDKVKTVQENANPRMDDLLSMALV